MNIKEFKNLYQNDNFYILDKDYNVLQHYHNVVNISGVMLIYLFLSQQESVGLTWIEFWNGNIFQSRQPILTNELAVDETLGLDLLHIMPLAIGITFNMVQIYGGVEQTSQPGSGYNFATINLSQTYTKFPGEYIQLLWNLQINSNTTVQLFNKNDYLLFYYGIVS